MIDIWFLSLWLIGYVLYTLAAVYYLFALLPAYVHGRRNYIMDPPPTVERIKKLMGKKGLDKVPVFKFQITTRGGELKVVERGIQSVFALASEPLFQGRLRVDVVTESALDEKKLKARIKDPPVPVNVYVVPKEYKTKNRTLRKARAHHYMIEQRQKEKDVERGYIMYFDAESVISPEDFSRLVYNTIRTGKRITAGPIVYPLRWFETNVLSRQMEANRPFHCYHCHKVMTDPPPQHLHGSNLVIEEKLAMDIGWDVGNLDGQPFIAEDIVFGLKAYINYGKEVFGWHGALLYEQPPMSLRDSVRQRVRWVTGVWQALEMLGRSKEFQDMSLMERIKLRSIIRYRVTLYSLGFFTGLFFFFFMTLWVFSLAFGLHYSGFEIIYLRIWAVFLVPGLALWLGGNQIGLARTLEHKDLTVGQKLAEHLKILIVSPFAGSLETAAAFYATVKWFLGIRKVRWVPTKK
jgi:beta-1,4-mannosyltransferase